jgi:vacuolar-type H+-ATPase subunit F/Vma7
LSKVLALVGEDLGAGFALSGVEILRTADPAAARSALEAAFASGAYGIIIIEEELVKGFSEETRKSLRERTIPLVITVPGEMKWRETEGAPADDYVARLIRRAVGYQLNIKL